MAWPYGTTGGLAGGSDCGEEKTGDFSRTGESEYGDHDFSGLVDIGEVGTSASISTRCWNVSTRGCL